jgi:ABC-type glycerol-3-phosphate transport system permease component
MRTFRAALLFLLLAAPALPQCVMCREAAKSQKEQAIAALNAGILLLGAPPAVVLFLFGRRILKGTVTRDCPRDEA